MNAFERTAGRLMEDHPHMYDTQHKHYLNKQLRKAACETVANQLILERVVENVSRFDVKSTFVRLRKQYCHVQKNINDPLHPWTRNNLTDRNAEIINCLHYLMVHVHHIDGAENVR